MEMSPRWMLMLGRCQRIELCHLNMMLFFLPSSCDVALWCFLDNCMGHLAQCNSALLHALQSCYFIISLVTLPST
jgi:hypothetical protein